ncbi:unnamed protein product, partial [Cuscuta epithymum]
MARGDKKSQLIHVSVMKEYGKQESWVTYFVITLYEHGVRELYNFEFFSHNGKVLMKGCYIGRTCVYDIKEEKLEETKFLVSDG